MTTQDNNEAAPKDWRKMLTEIGGYENEMIGVPASGVRLMVDEIEALRAQVQAASASQPAHEPSDFIVCGRAGNRRYDLEQVLRDALAASASQSSTPVPRVGGPDDLIGKLRSTLYAIANTLDDSELRSAAQAAYDLAHVARQRQEPTAYLATDLDGRGDVAFTEAEAKRRAGDGCNHVFPLFGESPTPSAAVAEGVDTALPEPLEIDWPQLNSQALGCGVEDRNLHGRYEAAEYGWQDGVDKAVERVPPEIYDREQMLTYGAQQREAGRREVFKDEIAWRDATIVDLSGKLSIAEAALARQPVSEGLTELLDWHKKELAKALDGCKRMKVHGSLVDYEARAEFHQRAVSAILAAVPPAKAEGLTSPAWLSEPAEPGTYWFAQGAEFPPVIVHLVSNFDGEIGVVSKYETGMGKAERFAPASSCQGLWSKIDAPRLPSSASAKQGLTAFSCAKAVPNSAFAACDKFCGNNETCILAQQAKGETK